MKNPIGTVVPNSIAAPKKTAKKLHHLYPNTTLADCQKVTARLYGHQDWFNLENAIKLGIKADLFDEDLPNEEYSTRLNAQATLLAKELSDVDMDQAYPPPDKSIKDAQSLLMGLPQELRLESAAKRYYQRMAYLYIVEYGVTNKKAKSKREYPKYISEFEIDIVNNLPKTLAAWWDKNIKHQPEVGKCLQDFELDVNSRISLLNFGNYWGTLCMYYAQVIPIEMMIGTSYLLAERYADITMQVLPEMYELQEKYKNAEISAQEFIKEQDKLKQTYLTSYYYAYPRDDFLEVQHAQPEAFLSNAEKTVKKLYKVKS